jgi:hypothetical protein
MPPVGPEPVLRGEVAQTPSEVGPDELDQVELGTYCESWKTVSHSRAAGWGGPRLKTPG